MLKRKLAILGVPSSAGARHTGLEKAPAALRRAGLIDRLQRIHPNVVDYGDLPAVTFRPDPEHPKQQNLPLVREVVLNVAARVDEIVRDDFLPVVLGGDCTIAIGVLAGLSKHYDDVGLIYFDGDLDLNIPIVSPSGIFDGMGLAHIIGKGEPALSQIGPRYPLVPAERVVAFGFNSLAGWIDPYEVDVAEHSAIIKYPNSALKSDPVALAHEALGRLTSVAEHVLVHLDVDVMSAKDFPASGVPHFHGLSYDDTVAILRVFTASPKLAGLVVAEFNAETDSDDHCAQKLVQALEQCFA